MAHYHFTYADGTAAQREAQVHFGQLVYPKSFNLPYLDKNLALKSRKGTQLIKDYDKCHKAFLEFKQWQRPQKKNQKALWDNQENQNTKLPIDEFMDQSDAIDNVIEERRESLKTLIKDTLWLDPDYLAYFIPVSECSIALPYKETEQWPDHAAYAAKYNVSEKQFTQIANALETHQKLLESGANEREIPNIGIIDGSEYGHPDTYLSTMSKTDPRLMLLGKGINRRAPDSLYCCDSIERTGGSQILAQIFSPTISTVVMRRKNMGHVDPTKDPIVGKATLWSGVDQNGVQGVCVNGWYGTYQSDFSPIIKTIADRLLTLSDAIQKITFATVILETKGMLPQIDGAEQLLAPALQDKDYIAKDYNKQALILSRRMMRDNAEQEI